MRKIVLILTVMALTAILAAPAMAGSRHRDYKLDWRPKIILPPPPVIIIKPFPDPRPEPYPYPPPPPPRGYYGGHWETRWEWDSYSQQWRRIEVWVDDYPYYNRHPHPRRW